jgi:2-octaprenyl-6-methoxyphenol hydroxylase
MAHAASYDVVIAGGGMVGAVLAYGLAQCGTKVACIDPVSIADAAEGQSSDSFDRRATACAMSSINLFRQFDLWSTLAPQAAAIRAIDVSKQGRWGKTRLRATDIELDAFGYVVPNVSLAAALNSAWAQLSADIAPTGYWGRRVLSASEADSRMLVNLDDGTELSAQLLVVADGGRSLLREQMGVASQTIASGQSAIVCNLRFEKDGQGRAFERFTANGPLALLPLGKQLYNLVWCGSAEQTAERINADSTVFAELLQHACGAPLGGVLEHSQRLAFPLDIVAADQVVAPRAVILGNAAQALHPVAGQGFNLGLRDAASLIEQLGGQRDCGAADVLRRYAQSRRLDRQQMLALTTQLATATALPTGSALSSGFGLGLAAFGQWQGARNMLARRASGFHAELPALCRPLVEL